MALSRWLSNGRCGTVLSRQSLHGRMVERIWGDLAIHPDCPPRWRPRADWFMETFFVDAKNRKSFSVSALLMGSNHPFWSWRAKALEQADKKHMLLVLMDRRRRLVAGAMPGTTHAAPWLWACRGGLPREDYCTFVDLAAWCAAAEPEAWGCPALAPRPADTGTTPTE